jgi:hypothetical protein
VLECADAANRATRESLGTTLKSQHQYNDFTGRLDAIRTGTANGACAAAAALQGDSYAYDAVGNVTSRSQWADNAGGLMTGHRECVSPLHWPVHAEWMHMNTESSPLRVLLWTARRWWHGPGALTVTAVCGVASLVLAGWAWQAAGHARVTRATPESQLLALRNEPPAVPLAVNTSTADFTAHLPATVAPTIALDVVQGAATRAAVAVQAVLVQEYAPSPERLGRTELAMTARGSYANLKRWLAELTERVPASTVSRLQLQRGVDAAADIEARLMLVVWSQPAVMSGRR